MNDCQLLKTMYCKSIYSVLI